MGAPIMDGFALPSRRLLSCIFKIFFGLFIFYCLLMYVYPFFEPILKPLLPSVFVDEVWVNVRRVWYNWQGFNAGITGGLVSGVLAMVGVYYTTNYLDDGKRRRALIAEKTFLAATLSQQFMPYFTFCGTTFLSTLGKKSNNQYKTFDQSSGLDLMFPKFPEAKESFVNCMSLAPYEISEFIAGFILKLQIFHARIEQTNNAFPSNGQIIHRGDFRGHILDLIELYAMTAKLMAYARGHTQQLTLTIEDFYEAAQSSRLGVSALYEDTDVEQLVKKAFDAGWTPMVKPFWFEHRAAD